MNINEMITLMEGIKENGISKFVYENGEEKITIQKKKPQITKVMEKETEDFEIIQEPHIDTTKYMKDEKIVKSLLVGTFYKASSPGKEPFVKVGDTVKKGQTLGIIEAMKLMNEIESEYDGVIEAILVDDEAVVEYGQPLFRIR